MAKNDPYRTLRLLAERPYTQLTDRPVASLAALVNAGRAVVVRRWEEHASGLVWHCEEVQITQAGRYFLLEVENLSS